MAATHEFKVTYKRVGLDPRRRKFARLASAERFIALLGPEPWLALGKDPDDFQCCSGDECGCGGATVRESDAAYREGMPDLEYVRLERRTVGPWEPAPGSPCQPEPGAVMITTASGRNLQRSDFQVRCPFCGSVTTAAACVNGRCPACPEKENVKSPGTYANVSFVPEGYKW